MRDTGLMVMRWPQAGMHRHLSYYMLSQQAAQQRLHIPTLFTKILESHPLATIANYGVSDRRRMD